MPSKRRIWGDVRKAETPAPIVRIHCRGFSAMDSKRNLTVAALLQAALLSRPEERPDLLRGFCRDDPSLRMEVEFLLAAHEEAQRILRQPRQNPASRPSGPIALPSH